MTCRLHPEAHTSPQRVLCHTYGRTKDTHIGVSGWPYSMVVALEPGRHTWTAPLDARRLQPGDDAATVTAGQLRDVVHRLIAAGQWQPGEPDMWIVADAAQRLATRLRNHPGSSAGSRLRYPGCSAIIESMNAETLSLQARARVHAALGDPARLAIVDALTLGDASPGEIAAGLGMPTNLVAHHVKVLADAGLLGRTRSEGDRRRTYLHLIPGVLSTLTAPRLDGAERVVFVCTRNSARSQLAAALWRRRIGGQAASAGTHPAPRVHPRAVRVAHEHGLALDPAGTHHVDDVVHDGDLIIAVCDNAHEDLTGPVRPRLHWSVPDPGRVDTDEAFEAAYAELADRIDRIAPALHPGAGHG
ncbi:protein-tyrosine-phosphatase [Actinoplanes xinjiangensis]|uniref:Protein-tyrosine-phosphatase n=2 Tax=Actinoplanes xinjiangensis TaxID=512350 RepID=A0A316EM92_9ACTN|nr:protein-tyrosine-phosphatase [Actinoplanes xinjiangensis]